MRVLGRYAQEKDVRPACEVPLGARKAGRIPSRCDVGKRGILRHYGFEVSFGTLVTAGDGSGVACWLTSPAGVPVLSMGMM